MGADAPILITAGYAVNPRANDKELIACLGTARWQGIDGFLVINRERHRYWVSRFEFAELANAV